MIVGARCTELDGWTVVGDRGHVAGCGTEVRAVRDVEQGNVVRIPEPYAPGHGEEGGIAEAGAHRRRIGSKRLGRADEHRERGQGAMIRGPELDVGKDRREGPDDGLSVARRGP